MQLILTLGILLFTVFLLGFIADPIIDYYLGPVEDYAELLEESASWLGHFLKGLASLGLLSFLKALFALSPFAWNMRPLAAGRNSGRNRAAQLNWIFILVGVGTFLWVCLTRDRYKWALTNCIRLSTKVFARGVGVP